MPPLVGGCGFLTLLPALQRVREGCRVANMPRAMLAPIRCRLDTPRFYSEMRRVLKPSGTLAAWGALQLLADAAACDCTPSNPSAGRGDLQAPQPKAPAACHTPAQAMTCTASPPRPAAPTCLPHWQRPTGGCSTCIAAAASTTMASPAWAPSGMTSGGWSRPHTAGWSRGRATLGRCRGWRTWSCFATQASPAR